MKKPDQSPQCQEAMPYYYDYLCGQQEQIPEAVSVHIAGCEVCQNEVQWLKQTDEKSEEFSLQKLQAISHAAQMQLHCALIDQPVRCSTIRSFLPILAIPEMAVRITTPVTAHIQACDECARDLETLKQLDLSSEQLSVLSEIFTQKQTEDSDDAQKVTAAFFQGTTALQTPIRRIMDRPDSGVVTCFRAQDASDAQSEKSFTVEVTQDDASPSTNPPADNTQIPKAQVTPAPGRPRWVLKPLAAAAAAIIIIGILLFQSPSVKATDIGQIYEALKNVQNVIMTQYEVDNPNPIQTTWICRSLGIMLLETNGSFALFDIKNNTRKTKADLTSGVQQTDLDHDMAQTIAGTMDAPWGLLPFKNTSDLPDGAVWEKVQPEGVDVSLEQIEVYDLFWTEEVIGNDANIDYQWRCHLDSTTKHPIKVEWWTQEPQQLEYELVATIEIAYPTEDQIQEFINQTGF